MDNLVVLSNCLRVVGLSVAGCDSDGNISWQSEPLPEQEEIVFGVLAAHEQPLTSDECLALQQLLTQEQWIAYQDARKQPIREQRAIRYKNDADTAYLKAVEDALRNKTEPDFTEWLAKKDAIREALPYPE